MGERFWLREEGMLEHEHVGRVAYINHHVRSASRIVGGVTQAYAWHLFIHVGTIVGFVESRGKVVLDVTDETAQPDDETAQPDDVTEYPDLKVRIILEDGRSITVEEEDRCSIWLPSQGGTVERAS